MSGDANLSPADEKLFVFYDRHIPGGNRIEYIAFQVSVDGHKVGWILHIVYVSFQDIVAAILLQLLRLS